MSENKHTRRFKKDSYIGQKFGRLVVLAEDNVVNHRRRMICKCDCGKTKTVLLGHLLSGRSRLCGCIQRELISRMSFSHGKTNTRLYNTWRCMRQRCTNPNAIGYQNYGERGIKVCDEWNDFNLFCKWAFEPGYREGLTIDRIDVNGNYEPSNCKWANRKDQANNKRNNSIININGVSHTVAEWADISGTKPNTITTRLKRGWGIKEAVYGR